MKRGFTLVETVIVVAIIAAMITAISTWFLNFKNTKQTDRNNDGLIYYDDLLLPEPPDYKEILAKYGINVSELSEEEIEEMVKELYERKT